MKTNKHITMLICLLINSAIWSQDFTLTFDTTQGSGGNTIILPMGGGNYDVDFNNDGNFNDTDAAALNLTNLSGIQTITFASSGTKIIRIRPNPTSNSSGNLAIAYAGSNDGAKLMSIDNWGTAIVWTTMANAFDGCTNMNISASAGTPNLSTVTSMFAIFRGASSLNRDLNSWDTSNVTSMRRAFSGATNFNGNISNWNVSKVTVMANMFTGASSFNGDLSSWNTSSVIEITGMFDNASSFNQDIGNWNVSGLLSMVEMFRNASSFNQDIGNWNISAITNLTNMFAGATGFSSNNYDNLLVGWAAQNVKQNVPFGAPPVKYCEQNARATLTNGPNNWNISGDDGLSQSCGDFTLTFNTSLGSGGNTIVLPMGANSYDVDFNNDGNFNDTDAAALNLTNLTGMQTITFSSSGPKTIRIRPNPTNNASGLMSMNFGNTTDGERVKLTSVDRWGENIVWTTMASTFLGCSNMNIVASAGAPNLSMVTNMTNMFRYATSVNQDLSSWNTSNVTNMNSMFVGASAFNSPINGWNVSNVTNMAWMFFEAAAFNQSLNSWNVSKVTRMENMFESAGSFNGAISNWNTASVTIMDNMFENATSFNQNIGSWNVSAVDNMNNMFLGATGFNSDNYDNLLIGWAAQNVKQNVTFRAPPVSYCTGDDARRTLTTNPNNWNISGDTAGCTSFRLTFDTTIGTPGTTITLPISGGAYDVDTDDDGIFDLINQSGTQNISIGGSPRAQTIRIRPNYTFNSSRQLQIRYANANDGAKLTVINSWGTAIIWTSMEFAFQGCSNLTIDPSAGAPDLSLVTNINRMFAGATSLNSDLSSWNVSNVTNMPAVFLGATSFNGNISTWNTSNVTNMLGVFFGASAFNQSVDSWDVSKVTHFSWMFSGATAFNQNLNSWNTSSATTMQNMFEGAAAFNSNISSWNTSSVTNMSNMFISASVFNQDISSWNVESVTTMNSMFNSAGGFSAENYSKLLNSWAVQNVQTAVPFGAPNKSYCSAASARDILTDPLGKNWNISGDVSTSCSDLTLTFDTNEGSGGVTITLPITGRYDVDWNNDGVYNDTDANSLVLNNLNGTQTITFSSGGEKTIRIRPNAQNIGNGLRIAYNNGNDPLKLKSIVNWGDHIVWTSMANAFRGCANMTINAAAGAPNLSSVTSMESMLEGASSFNSNLNAWNVSNVTNMKRLFFGNVEFNMDLSNWNVSNVTNMLGTFFGASKFNQPLDSWNVSKVTDFGWMFSGATVFNQNLNSWNTASVTTMENMFEGAAAFNGNISGWNTSSVINMNRMFVSSSVFNQDIGNWNTASVTNMSSVFSGAAAFNQNIGAWNISAVTSMNFMFSNANSFSSDNYDLLLIGWAAQSVNSNVTFTAPPTSYCSGASGRATLVGAGWNIGGDTTQICQFTLTFNTNHGSGGTTITLPISGGAYDVDINNDGVFGDTDFAATPISLDNLTTTTVITFDSPGQKIIGIRPNPTNNAGGQLRIAFANGNDAQKLVSINSWGQDIVWTTMVDAFYGCSNLNISALAGVPNLSSVQDMTNMFRGTTALNSDLNSWNTSSVTTMNHMFSGATIFNGAISNWNTQSVTNMGNMFLGAAAFNQNIGSWNVSNVTTMESMFQNANTFNQALNSWNTASVTTMQNMFSGAAAFNGDISSWNTSNVTIMEDLFKGAIVFNQNLNAWNIANVTNMDGMFEGTSAFNSDVSGWNTSKVTTMKDLFKGAALFNQNINSWNVSSVTNFSWMFSGAEVFNRDLNSWNTSSGTSMENMFEGAVAFNGNISGWNTSSITVMNRMFLNANAFNHTIGNWNVELVADMDSMFSGANSFSAANYNNLLNGWSTQNVRSGVNFGAPSVTYCAHAARNVLTTTKSWNITGDTGFCSESTVKLVFDTQLGDVNGTTIVLPIIDGMYDVDVDNDGDFTDTGDGGALLNVSNTQTISFGSAGEKTIGIRASVSNTNSQLRIEYNNVSNNHPQKLKRIVQWGGANIVWTSMANAFKGCTNLTIDGAAGVPNLSSVTSMESIFEGASSLNSDLNSWNVSNVTNMSNSFNGAAVFNQSLNSWNVSNVTTMDGMFEGASAFNGSISGWNTSKVTTMQNLFKGAALFNQNLNTWNVSIVTNMMGMFEGASVFNQDLNSWNTQSVTNMGSMFLSAAAFNRNIGSWNVSNVTNMNSMFSGATAFNGAISNWNTQNVTNMESMFLSAAAFNQNIGNWNVSKVTNMNSMFSGATAFNGAISNWNTSSVTAMQSMFLNASTFNQGLNSWNVQSVTTMENMFQNAGSFNQDLNSWNTTAVTTIQQMFSGATAFNGDISSWNTSAMTSMISVFAGATAFNRDLSNWNTAAVTNMTSMFSGATTFDQNLGSWNISAVANMTDMFLNATGFSKNNYDNLLNGWAAQTVQQNVVFKAPPTDYCLGTASRATLAGANWDITGDGNEVCNDLRLVFNTEASDPGSRTIRLPIFGGRYDVDLNNDGIYGDTDDASKSLDNLEGIQVITFATSGVKTIRIRANPTSNPTRQLQIQYWSGHNAPKLTTIESWGDNIVWTSMLRAFQGCSNMNISASAGAPNLSMVSDMSYIFQLASSFNSDVSSWNTSNVTNMSYAFNSTPVFNQPLNAWNTSSVTLMTGMFQNTGAFNQNLNSWNTSSVTHMHYMFASASAFNGVISNWNTSNVTNMTSMFQDASSYNQNMQGWDVSSANLFNMFRNATSFNGDVSNWNTGAVTSFENLFFGAESFNQPLNSWNTSSATNMSGMFALAKGFNQPLDNWNVSNVTNMTYMFYDADSFNQDLNTWNTSNVTNMSWMFSLTDSFNGEISNWNTSSVTTMQEMFSGAGRIDRNIGAWNITAVTNMIDMFNGTSSVSNLNYDNLLIGWAAQSVQSNVTFKAPYQTYCSGQAAKDILTGKGWNISGDRGLVTCRNLTLRFDTRKGTPGTSIVLPISGDGVGYDVDVDNDGLFNDAGSILNATTPQTIDFGSAGIHVIRIRANGTSNPSKNLRIEYANANDKAKLISIDRWGDNIVWTSMANAFYGCSNMNISALAGAPILSSVTDMSSMFRDASSLNQDLSSWNTSSVTNMFAVFRGASSFNQDLNSWNTSQVTSMRRTFSDATNFNGNISNWNVSKVTVMANMFTSASSFNGDLSSWNTSSVIDMGGMFSNAGSFNQDIGNWNVSAAIGMTQMFQNASSFNQNIGNWNISKVTNMTDMFAGATNFSQVNYDNLLTGWSSRSVVNGITFTAPPVSYCNGEAGFNILNGQWTINNNQGKSCQVLVNAKICLYGVYESSSNMMRASLGSTYLPTNTPYSDGATANVSVFNVSGNKAIVDWVLVELRDKNDITTVLHSISGLLQRDGNIVGTDGTSTLTIAADADDYYVAVKHKNHIPIASDAVVSLSNVVSNVDLTVSTNVRGGAAFMHEVATGVHAMLAGDTDGNGQIQASDFGVLLTNFGLSGYRGADIDLNGQVQASEMLILLANIGKGVQF